MERMGIHCTDKISFSQSPSGTGVLSRGDIIDFMTTGMCHGHLSTIMCKRKLTFIKDVLGPGIVLACHIII